MASRAYLRGTVAGITIVDMTVRTARFSTPGRAHAEESIRGIGRAIVVERTQGLPVAFRAAGR